MENIKAKFQLLDNYVKNYSLELKRKIQNNEDVEVNGQISFGIVNITKENSLIGEVELANEIDLIAKGESVGKIHIVMGALFEGELEIEKDFEKMLQINGATTLSHIMRTYIITNTALSGMPTITLPMINFVEFFNNANAKDSKNK